MDTNIQHKNYRIKDFIINFIITPLVTLPIFIVLHKIIPDFDVQFNLDRILLFILLLTGFEILFNLFNKVAYAALILMVSIIIFGTIRGKYGAVDVFFAYRNMFINILEKPNKEEFNLISILPNPLKKDVIKAINYDNDTVRNFAVQTAGKFFSEYKTRGYYSNYRTIIQSFSIFKEINNNWNYVHDPKSREYFARASETINNHKGDPNNYFSGDCDDHAILMVACITAIGGSARLVWTEGHMYPELCIGDESDIEDIVYLIRYELFVKEINAIEDKQIYYHIEADNKIWLNLDYTEHFPGGKFHNEVTIDVYEP